MSLRLSAFTCGTITCEQGRLMQGGEGDITIPMESFLIEHPKGTALFDTGLHPLCRTDPAGHLGDRMAQLFRPTLGPGEDVAGRLQAIDRDPARIDFIVTSHLHFDHVGGNALIPNATLVVQRREWEAGRDPDLVQQAGLDPEDFDHGHKILAVDGEHDLFGDGSVVCLPTYGHTPGHQSLKLRMPGGDIVLTGDACYFCRSLAERRLPRFVYDAEQMLHSYDRLEALQRQGARLIFGHDPGQWATIPKGAGEAAF